jgi:predicted restriction endonuclease
MSQKKKQVRANFRTAVFTRDGWKCKFCEETEDLDAHHITDRTEMPNGGYVEENGISLCKAHHELAEVFHSTGTAAPGFAPEDLYKIIGSDYEKAVKASEKLK